MYCVLIESNSIKCFQRAPQQNVSMSTQYMTSFERYLKKISIWVLYDFLGIVKAVPHENVIRTGQPKT